MPDAAGLLYLLQVTSAAFPSGSFSHSLGFETLVADGAIGSAERLEAHALRWLRFSLAPLDGAAVGLAREAAAREDLATLAELDRALGAMKLPRESLEASLKTGNAFLAAAERAFGGSGLARYRYAVTEGLCTGHAATVFGVCAGDAGIAREEAVLAYLYSSYANLVTVVARLVPLGQIDVQRLLSGAREPLIEGTALALARRLEDLSSAAAFLDVASMRHERLYTRLCIS